MDDYSGYQGYEKLLSGMTESFYDAYPEYRGRIVVIDMQALEINRETELERVSKELGVINIEDAVGEAVTSSGMAYVATDDTGRKIAAVAGWNIHRYPDEQTVQDHINHVSVVAHELAHAHDHIQGTLDIDLGTHETHYIESYADSFRVALATLDGGDDAGVEQFIARYDKRQITARQDNYDNGEALTETYLQARKYREEMGIGKADISTRFTHWKESQMIADQVRQNHLGTQIVTPENRAQYVYEDETSFQAYAKISDIVGDKIDEMVVASFFQSGEDKKGFTKAVHSRVATMDVKAYEAGESRESEREQFIEDIAYEVRGEALQWYKDRKDYIPQADRIIAADAYLRDAGEFADYQIPEHNAPAFLGRAAKMVGLQGEDYDVAIAEAAADEVIDQGGFEGTILDGKSPSEIVVHLAKNCPKQAESLANGATVKMALGSEDAAQPKVNSPLMAVACP